MSEIKRISKQDLGPDRNVEGSTFHIPKDILPQGIESGKECAITLRGFISLVDENGAIMQLKEIGFAPIEVDKPIGERVQVSLEKGLTEGE